MFELAAAYVVAISMLVFCGLSALTLIHTVNHLDPLEASKLPEPAQENAAV